MRRITERTVVAAMSSMRVKAALLRSVSVNLAELRRVLMFEGLNMRRVLGGWYVESVADVA
jgi:hypothetical protein